MVSTPKGFSGNSTISPIKSTAVNKPRAQKSLCLFTNILDVKKKLLPVELELLNTRARKLNIEVHHVH